ncbi:hypothetical protein GWI33_001779 [Rhynchophorus ferrugineus]|uniref:Uncharacterized protein n=1 Tax=Rhynchophorus ferrugineus TaxID=354439 RepID=A0A834IQ67_RHYFE|nr:hypothetical protein GWI33_001779 [Rhynchophorus ferrugineus]
MRNTSITRTGVRGGRGERSSGRAGRGKGGGCWFGRFWWEGERVEAAEAAEQTALSPTCLMFLFDRIIIFIWGVSGELTRVLGFADR